MIVALYLAALAASDPYEAYAAGKYDDALAGFLDDQVAHPDDPEAAMRVGSAHYQMRNWGEAEKAFGAAALRGDGALRARAMYNLGNVAFRQGKLEDAIARYQAALDLDPNDADAKKNVEIARNEIRRRHEEAQKRQQQQQPQQQQQQQQQQEQQQEQQPEQQQGQQGEPQQESSDTDGDGLSDALERSAKNRTDPQNKDSDGDGLADGQEDANANGAVDAGETDPTKPDSDGNGVSDAAESPAAAQGQTNAGEAREQKPGEKLTAEEAARLLRAVEEGRPEQQRRARGRSSRPARDW